MLDFKNIGKRNICLIGLMGSGKTIIGKELSKVYKIKHFDSDNEIEKNEGKNINSIFKIRGEEYFRKIEEKTSLELLEKSNIERVVKLIKPGQTELEIAIAGRDRMEREIAKSYPGAEYMDNWVWFHSERCTNPPKA